MKQKQRTARASRRRPTSREWDEADRLWAGLRLVGSDEAQAEDVEDMISAGLAEHVARLSHEG